MPWTPISWITRLFGIGVIVWLIWAVGTERLLTALKGLSLAWLPAVAMLLLAASLLKAIRWWAMLSSLTESRLPTVAVAEIHLASSFLGYITPARLGELSRITCMRSRYGMPATTVLPSIIADRGLDVVCVGALACLAAPATGLIAAKIDLPLGPATLALAIALSATAGVVWALIPSVRRAALAAMIAAALEDTARVFRRISIGDMLLLVALTLASNGCLIGACYAISLGFGHTPDPSHITFAVSTAMIASSLPISVMGLGTREAIFIAVLSTAGIGAGDALAISLTYWVTSLVFGNGPGALILLRHGPHMMGSH